MEGNALRGEPAPAARSDEIPELNATPHAEATRSQEHRARLEMALEASGMIGVWDGDLANETIYGDANFARIYGMPAAETETGKPLGYYFGMMHPDDAAEATAEMVRMRAGADVYAHEHRIIRPDGGQAWVAARGRLTRNETGEPIRFLGVSVDITERKEMERRQAFLLALERCLQPAATPHEVLAAAMQLLGRQLGADRAGYAEFTEGDISLVRHQWCAPGFAPVPVEHRMVVSGPGRLAALRAGTTLRIDDTLNHPTARSPAHLAVFDDNDIRAFLSVPLIRGGGLAVSVFVQQSRPRRWTDEDVALTQEFAERTFAVLETARAEARLKESEQRLRLALEFGGLGSWEYEIATGKTMRSLQHDRIFGYQDGAPAWSFEDFLKHIVPEDRAAADAGFWRSAQTGTEWLHECRIIPAGGGRKWIEIRARREADSAGNAIRLLGTVADITERKRNEAALEENASQFRTFAQAMPNHFWTAPPDGLLDWFNDRVLAYAGLAMAALQGNGWASIVHPDDLPGAAARWAQSLASGLPYETEFRLRRNDGVYRWHIARAVAVRAEDGRVARWIGTNTDIEEQKNTAEALAFLNANLERQVDERTAELMAAEESLRQSQKMEAVGQLTGGLAHDFNNLLTGITGSLELLETRLAQGRTGELSRYLHVAQTASKRAASLTHRLLAFSRRQTLAPEPTDINRLAAGMNDLIGRTVGPAIAVEMVGAAGLWTTLVDPNQLENALLNLCINARDAMPDGGRITIETANRWLDWAAAKASDLAVGQYVSLCVSDTGCGMPPDVVARAFDPFFTTKPLGEGTGLGLSMVYGFARQSGGQARIYSETGLGTMICLYLPRHAGGVEAAPAVPLPGPAAHRAEDGETVLVVDDEPSVRMLVAEVLEDMGYTPVEAENGPAGLAILETARRIDLLITDVGLPGGMNGRQLADAALIHRPGLKVLFITGYAENAVIGNGRLQPGMHVLTKPFGLETLATRIKDIISGA